MDPFVTGSGAEVSPVSGSVIGPGSEVGPFRILRILGRGGMGVVWLARDQRLGRKVALKVIDAARLVAVGARERFRREAAATAQLSHAHIVTLYEVGELDGTPWVALEYIEGATLRARLQDDSPPLREALGIAQAIVDALGAAHRAGILHRDLKPTNIILGKDGRPRVVDFGLARRVGDPTAEFVRVAGTAEEGDEEASTLLGPLGDSGAVGTPKYMAPEQWRREEPTTAADVWAFGLVLHELVHGCHPYDQLDRRGLRESVQSDDPVPSSHALRPVAPALAELIAQCLDKRPAARPTAEAAHAALGRLLERTAPADEGDSPFRGLLAFSERHADTFFGRDAEAAAFLERLRDEPVLPVVGASGAGKSSFVQAGVVPRLRERGWSILHVRPGRHPLVALAQRLVLGELSMPSPMTHAQETGSTMTAAGMPKAHPERRDRVATDTDELAARLGAEPGLLGIELRALAESRHGRILLFVDQLEEIYAGVPDDERRAFLRALANAADDPGDPVRLVVTLRDDFLGRIAEVDEAAVALSHVTVLRSPGPEALHDILIRPAERAGYRWDDGLVDDMVAAVAAAPAGLPLLAFTARQVWHRRDRDTRRLTRASYDELGGVAGALAAHADGVIAGLPERDERVVRDLLLRLVTAEGTRRVVARSDLLAGLPAPAPALLQSLIDARLVTTRRALAAGGDAEVELAHESLIHTWDRLARWIDEGRDDRGFLEHATRAAAHWRARGRRHDDLWHGEALGDARRTLVRLGARVPDDVRALLTASERDATRSRRRKRLLVATGAAVLVAIAVSAWVAAFRISREEQAARRRFAEAQREAARAALSSGDLLAARARLRSSLEVEDSLSARALWMRLAEEPLVWAQGNAGAIYDVAVSPDGATFAACGQEGLVRMIDRETSRDRIFADAGDQLISCAWSADGAWIVGGSWNGELSLWDASTRQRRGLAGHRGVVHAVIFRGGEVISVGEDGTLRRWDIERGAATATWRDDGSEIADVAIGPEGELITASWDGGIRRWTEAGVPTVITQRPAAATALAIAGDEILVGDRDGNVIAWSARGSRPLGHVEGQVSRLVRDPDSGRIAVAASTGRIEVWDASGTPLQLLDGHDGDARALAVAGSVLVSGGNDHEVRLWDLAVRSRRLDPGHTMTVVGVDVSPDGRLAISAGYDKVARLWDVDRGRTIGVLRGHQSRVYSAKLLPGGRSATASADGTFRLWQGIASVAVAPLALPGGRFYDLGASADGSLIAAGGTDGKLHLWWPATDEVRSLEVNGDGTVDGLGLSPDGTLAATGGSDTVVRLFDVATGSRLRELRGHTTTVAGVAFSPDAARIASCDENGAVWSWDARTGEGRRIWQGARSYRVAFHPDGRHVGVASADGLARLLDADGIEAPRELRGHLGEVNEIRFSADGTLAITGSNDFTVRVWDVATGAQRWQSARAATPWREPVPADLEDLPATPPRAGARGPAGTIALGFPSGVVGLWDLATGEHLDDFRLHGPVTTITVSGATVSADSELGDHAELDLSPLELPYCDLLRTVWSTVPVVWEGLRPVRAAPPRGHRCAR